MTDEESYGKQILQMAENAKGWLRDNPGASPKVQFNFTENVFVCASISGGIKEHFVSCNDDGLAMVKAMWPWDVDTEPTVGMVKFAIKHIHD